MSEFRYEESGSICGYSDYINELELENEKLEKENKILRECVEFYANKSVWGIAAPSDLTSIDLCDVGEVFHQEIGITSRGGKKARETLKQLKESK